MLALPVVLGRRGTAFFGPTQPAGSHSNPHTPESLFGSNLGTDSATRRAGLARPHSASRTRASALVRESVGGEGNSKMTTSDGHPIP
jgi:hypothetical protein